MGHRSLITARIMQVEHKIKIYIYIADLQSMAEAFSRRLRKISVYDDDGTSGGTSSVTAGVEPE